MANGFVLFEQQFLAEAKKLGIDLLEDPGVKAAIHEVEQAAAAAVAPAISTAISAVVPAPLRPLVTLVAQPVVAFAEHEIEQAIEQALPASPTPAPTPTPVTGGDPTAALRAAAKK